MDILKLLSCKEIRVQSQAGGSYRFRRDQMAINTTSGSGRMPICHACHAHFTCMSSALRVTGEHCTSWRSLGTRDCSATNSTVDQRKHWSTSIIAIINIDQQTAHNEHAITHCGETYTLCQLLLNVLLVTVHDLQEVRVGSLGHCPSQTACSGRLSEDGALVILHKIDRIHRRNMP